MKAQLLVGTLEYVKSVDDSGIKERDGGLHGKMLLEVNRKRSQQLLVVTDGLGIEWIAGGGLEVEQLLQLS